MKHGHAIPKENRPAMARRALAIVRSASSHAEALRQIETEFAVSNPTARNLVGYGRFLEEHKAEVKLI